MNPWLATAAALTVAIAVAHSWLGERYLVGPLLSRSDLPRLFGADIFTKRTIRFAWHLTSIAWLGLGALLLVAAGATTQPAPRFVGDVVAVTFLASGLVALVGSRGRHLSWIVFAAIAAATWWGFGR